MKDFSEFLNSNVSDELLAAYIDGNTTAEETLLIENCIKEDSIISEANEIVGDSTSFGSGFDWELHKGDFGFWELGLPSSVSEKNIEASKMFGDHEKEISNIINEKNMNELNKKTYGEGCENIYDPVYVHQPDDHSCALRSQQIVLRDFGIDIPFDDLEKLALEYGVYTDQGTYTYDIGKVLQIAGIGMHQVNGGTILDLTNELAQGHRIIVSVDADELWYNDSITGKLRNWFNDTFGHQGGNHALIVAGIDVNPGNPNDIKVILTDPGTGGLRVEYSLDQFMDAWKDSNCFMAATDIPAPYQYDAKSGMEVPSNFVVEQHMNQFVTDNSYQLAPDMINIPKDYTPVYNGHINQVGDIPYDVFAKQYEELYREKDFEEVHQNFDIFNDDEINNDMEQNTDDYLEY